MPESELSLRIKPTVIPRRRRKLHAVRPSVRRLEGTGAGVRQPTSKDGDDGLMDGLDLFLL